MSRGRILGDTSSPWLFIDRARIFGVLAGHLPESYSFRWISRSPLVNRKIFGFRMMGDDSRGGLFRIELELFRKFHVDTRRVK